MYCRKEATTGSVVSGASQAGTSADLQQKEHATPSTTVPMIQEIVQNPIRGEDLEQAALGTKEPSPGQDKNQAASTTQPTKAMTISGN